MALAEPKHLQAVYPTGPETVRISFETVYSAKQEAEFRKKHAAAVRIEEVPNGR